MSRGKPKYTCPLNLRVREEVFIKLVNNAILLKHANVSLYVREIINEKLSELSKK